MWGWLRERHSVFRIFQFKETWICHVVLVFLSLKIVVNKSLKFCLHGNEMRIIWFNLYTGKLIITMHGVYYWFIRTLPIAFSSNKLLVKLKAPFGMQNIFATGNIRCRILNTVWVMELFWNKRNKCHREFRCACIFNQSLLFPSFIRFLVIKSISVSLSLLNAVSSQLK